MNRLQVIHVITCSFSFGKNISDRIKKLRKKTGLSQNKFSAKFGIPVRTLQQWEQGISAPPDYLVRMMSYIMLLEGNRHIKHEESEGEDYGDDE